MTGAIWPSSLVAALFAAHPLRVESVAWVTERKDVLSGLFFLLTLWAYAWYVRKPGARGRYLAVVGLFVLGLMCKAMLVTLPAVLLLLDYWPLGRLGPPAGGADGSRARQFWLLLREKIPLFALSAVACVVQVFSAQPMLATLEGFPLSWRLGNAVVSYAAYLGQTFYPAGLAVFYPHPEGSLAGGKIVAAALLLVCASGVAWTSRRRYPYVFTGWFWFLGMLVPVIGIVQSGTLARADRYTYLPHIGLSVVVAWLTVDLCAGLRHRRWVLGGAAVAAIMAMIWCSERQASYWKSSHALWVRALDCTGSNATAHSNLGHFFLEHGRLDDAEAHIRKTLEIAPDFAAAHNNLGLCLLARGEAAAAVAHLQTAVAIQPRFARARGNLGTALIQTGRTDEAITQYLQALEISPDMAGLENNLGGAFLQKRRVGAAIAHYEKAIETAPRQVSALKNLAWVLATCPEAALRNGARAVALAERASQLSGGGDVLVQATLSAAYAEAGRFAEAVTTAEQALRSPGLKSEAMADRLRRQIQLFQAQTAFHETYEVRP